MNDTPKTLEDTLEDILNVFSEEDKKFNKRISNLRRNGCESVEEVEEFDFTSEILKNY